MSPYFYKHHYKFGWDKQFFGRRPHPDALPFRTFGAIERQVDNFKNECLFALQHLWSRVKGKHSHFNLLLSGGIDSEIIARCLLELEIPFQCTIYKWQHDLNMHDIKYGIHFCKEHNLEFEIKPFDILSFINSESLDWMDDYNVSAPYLAVFKEYVIQAEGFCIHGGGNTNFYRENNLNAESHLQQWFWTVSEDYHSPLQFFYENDIECCFHFFAYSPELLFSYINDPVMKLFWKYKDSFQHSVDHTDMKAILCAQYWPSIKPRPKMTGYEKINSLHKFLRLKRAAKPEIIQKSMTLSLHDFYQTLTNSTEVNEVFINEL